MRRFFTFTLLLLSVFLDVKAENLYVPSGQYPTIQSAINDANDGDYVIVEQGVYKENINFLGKAITLTSTDPNDPNIVEATTIDGNEPNDANYASVVIFNSGEDNSSVITGFTITGGTGSWVLISWKFQGLNWNRCGGGIICYNMSEPTITKNIFKNNNAAQGGGIYCYGDPVNTSAPSEPAVHISPIITDNTFIENTAIIDSNLLPPNTNYPHNDHGDGGAIVGFQGCDAIISGNIFQYNEADAYGGAIHLRQWSNGTIENNYFSNNNALIGGAIHITYTSSPEITKNHIESNSGSGAAIYAYYLSEPLINRNIIRLNNSTNGIIGIHYDSGGEITNNIIEKNTQGPAILLTGSSPLICHNTIYDNEKYGILCNSTAEPEIKNNIIASTSKGFGIAAAVEANPTITYNNIWNNEFGNYGDNIDNLTGQQGNISTNPKFVNEQPPLLHLNYNSPCIGTGDPNFTSGFGQLDIDGNPRIINIRTDMGADEALPVWNITSQTQHLKIQDAVNDSNDEDTIIATKGHYFETIHFSTHQVVLSSLDPNDSSVVKNTIIDANNIDTAVTITGLQDANTILRGFTIQNGFALSGNGGAIYCSASPTIEKNIIIDNIAFTTGGGLYIGGINARPFVVNNKISGNLTGYGGAVFCDADTAATIRNNLIVQNEATFGGAIYCFLVTDTLILNNQILANTATDAGGIYSALNDDTLKIIGNLFCGNYADSGGGILAEHSSPDIISNSFIASRANLGSGLYLETYSSPLVSNNIIAFSDLGEGIYCLPDLVYPSEPNLLYNNVFGNIDGDYAGSLTDHNGLNGNMSIDPNIIDIGSWYDPNTPADFNDDIYFTGNYHLTPYSPCIDAGDNNSLPLFYQTDIDGEERIFDSFIDIGADEFVTNPYDLNFDGTVDYYELSILQSQWLQNVEDFKADFYEDGFIDFLDLAKLAEQWSWTAGWFTSTKKEALQFDNSSDGCVWIHTPEGCILNNVFTFTYTAWIYPLDFSQTNARIIGKNERAMLISTGGVLKGYSHGGGIPFSVSAPGTLETDKWQFVAMVYDYYQGDKLIHLYVNSEEVSYQSQTLGEETRPPLVDWRTEGEWDLFIGSQAWNPGTYIPNAIIDETAIYDKVLTEQEMQYLYNNGFGRPDAQSLNPIGLWHFDEGQGTTVFDSSGYDNHGQLIGTTPPAWTDGKLLEY